MFPARFPVYSGVTIRYHKYLDLSFPRLRLDCFLVSDIASFSDIKSVPVQFRLQRSDTSFNARQTVLNCSAAGQLKTRGFLYHYPEKVSECTNEVKSEPYQSQCQTC